MTRQIWTLSIIFNDGFEFCRLALQAILSSFSSKPISAPLWKTLTELGLTRSQATRRGCRAGCRKQRPISICLGNRLQDSAKNIGYILLYICLSVCLPACHSDYRFQSTFCPLCLSVPESRQN